MVIRNEQVEAFRKAARDNFTSEVVVHVRTKHPRFLHGESEAALRAQLELLLASGRGYGIEQRRNLKYYIDFLILNGLDCLGRPDFAIAESTLRNLALPEGAKITFLNDFQVFALSLPSAQMDVLPPPQRERA